MNITVVDVRVIHEAIKVINESLNKAVLNGSYTMDDAFQYKLSINNLSKTIDILEKDQSILVKMAKKTNE